MSAMLGVPFGRRRAIPSKGIRDVSPIFIIVSQVTDQSRHFALCGASSSFLFGSSPSEPEPEIRARLADAS